MNSVFYGTLNESLKNINQIGGNFKSNASMWWGCRSEVEDTGRAGSVSMSQVGSGSRWLPGLGRVGKRVGRASEAGRGRVGVCGRDEGVGRCLWTLSGHHKRTWTAPPVVGMGGKVPSSVEQPEHLPCCLLLRWGKSAHCAALQLRGYCGVWKLWQVLSCYCCPCSIGARSQLAWPNDIPKGRLSHLFLYHIACISYYIKLI